MRPAGSPSMIAIFGGEAMMLCVLWNNDSLGVESRASGTQSEGVTAHLADDLWREC